MIDKDLLAILACPESHQSLSELSAACLKQLNDKIQSGGAKTVGGVDVSQPLESGLVREDKTVVYPVRDAIPVLLMDEGIAVGELGLTF